MYISRENRQSNSLLNKKDSENELLQSLIEARMNQNVTQKELALRTGITQADISRIENGTRNPSLAMINRLAAGLRMRLRLEPMTDSLLQEDKSKGLNNMEQIVNKTDYMTGTEGEYLGIRYKWTKDEDNHQLLTLYDNGTEQLIAKSNKLLTDPNMKMYYEMTTYLYIELYLKKKNINSILEEVHV